MLNFNILFKGSVPKAVQVIVSGKIVRVACLHCDFLTANKVRYSGYDGVKNYHMWIEDFGDPKYNFQIIDDGLKSHIKFEKIDVL